LKLGFLELPSEQRRLYIEQAATRRSVSPVILEKDFWVCWLRGILFQPDFASSLVFKGGTQAAELRVLTGAKHCPCGAGSPACHASSVSAF
jgi:hypothetical protein